MDEFMDEEEQYEILYEEELRILREMEQEMSTKFSKSRQNLNLRSQPGNEASGIDRVSEESDRGGTDVAGHASREVWCSGKRQLSVESLYELDDELEVIEPPSKKIRNDASHIKEFSVGSDCGITSLRFPKWPFVMFNTCDGERFYVKFRENDEEMTEAFDANVSKPRLLRTPYKKLKALAEKTIKACEGMNASNSPIEEVTVNKDDSDLWVEMYRPKKYVELLSDESVNRSLLGWLKKWDKIVFNKTNAEEFKTDQSSSSGIMVKTHQNKHKNEINNGFDSDGRPHFKIALLCGPPGLGKTTLAHVIADIAGYNAVEVNASDDRSIEAFQTRLEAATQMRSVMGSNRPNCLILDEIDGAPASSIEYLLKYVNGKISEKGSSTKKEKLKIICKRPVVCICNEPYKPSLRQLRQQAYVLHVPPIASHKLSRRLLEICKQQNIRTDLSSLTILCNKMQSDIRCCISSLCFFKTRNGCLFKQSDAALCSTGQKDIQKGLFSKWQEVFQIPPKKSMSLNKSSTNFADKVANFYSSSGNLERLHYIVALFHNGGDFERLRQGVHENFLKMNFPETIKALSSGTKWFCWSDIIDTYIKENQNYVLLPYLPYTFAAWHFLFSSYGYARITYPKVDYEMAGFCLSVGRVVMYEMKVQMADESAYGCLNSVIFSFTLIFIIKFKLF